MEGLMKSKEVAAFLNVGFSTLEMMRMKGKGPKYVRLGKHTVRYRKEDVVEWVNACANASENHV